MATSTGANVRWGYAAEATIGTTPANPEFKTLEFTGSGLKLTKDLIESALLGGRDRKCLRHGNRTVGGDLNTLLIYGHQDELIEAALCGTWEGDTLTNGAVRRGFTFVRQDPDIGTDAYRYYTGCEINTMNLSLTPNDDVQLTFGIIGVDNTPGQAAITGQSFTTPTTNCPFDYKRGEIRVGGEVVANMTSFNVQVENGMESSFVLFSNVTGNKSIGKFNVTGNITAQFDGFTQYNLFEEAEKVSVVIVLQDGDGNEYEVELPRVLLNTADDDVGGEGEITMSSDFTAEIDNTAGYTMQISRTAAA